ncbi:glycoside hydrolase family 16 protein [Mycena floridula]|nr:glycoside hydrolase family 16 protein [Mycena floridula]
MLNSIAAIAFPLILTTSVAAQTLITCNFNNPCPYTSPCCSEYGYCGTGTFCLGGCNPMTSYLLSSCAPNPICQDATHTFPDNSRILLNASTTWNGDASAYDWTLDQGDIFNSGQSELIMTLSEANGGTRLSSTRFIHYGTITARMRTSRWAGVVTAFITMSNVKDEIDWEFPGGNVTEGQSNYFWQGIIPTSTHGGVAKGLTDTFANYHDYTIDWQRDTLTWLVDGNVVRTLNQADTIVNGISNYPNTPSRIQFSLWPSGVNTSAPGTIDWGGGYINYQDPDYLSAGHFYNYISSVTIKCADSPAANMKSYSYGGNSTKNTPLIITSDRNTLSGSGAMSMFKVPGPRTLGLVSIFVTASALAL